MANGVSDINEMMNSRISAIRDNDDEASYPYIIFELFKTKLAVNCKYVLSIEQVAETTEIVNNAAREIRGISYYKNEPISIFDMRQLLGLTSKEEYIGSIVNLPQRIRDHEAYAQTLKDCVHSGAPFELTTDPHKCAFGKWFYAHKNEGSTSIEIRNEMTRIEPLHAKFHETAKTVRDCIGRGRLDEAAKHLEEVEKLRDITVGELNMLNELMYKNVKELNIILQLKDKKIGLIVDNAESVEDIDEIQNLPPSVATTNYIKRLGLSKRERNIIFILEAAEFNKH